MKNRIAIILSLNLLFSTVTLAQGWIPLGENMLPENYFTWALSAVDDQTVWSLNFSAQHTDPILIGTRDAGETWSVIDLSSFPVFPMDLHATSADTLWMPTLHHSGNTYLYFSENAGTDWEVKHIYQGNFQAIGPTIKFGDKDRGIMIDPDVAKAFYTLDGGLTWEATTAFPILEPDESWDIINPSNWMDVQGDTIWWGTSLNIHRSTDNGITWEVFENGFNGDYQTQSLCFNESGTGLMITNVSSEVILPETLIHKSNDGGQSWTAQPVVKRPLEGITDVPGMEQTFVAVGGILKEFIPNLNLEYVSLCTMDGGETWHRIGEFPLNAVDFVSNSVGWAGRLSYYDYGSNPALFKWEGSFLSVATKELTVITPKVFPNPVENTLQVRFSKNRQGVASLKDSSGRTIQQKVFHSQELEFSNLDHLPSGVYIFELKGEDFIATEKVVKQ